jgi:hypothetical protein
MLTERTIKIPIYDYKVKVVIFDDKEEVYKKYPQVSPIYLGCTLESIDSCTVIIPPNDAETMVHECEHIKNCLWRYIGYTPQPSNDEVDAYLLMYIFSKIKEITQKHLLATKC